MTRKRVDANQPAIVAALRQIGATVQHLHMVGQGCPDLLVGFQGKNHLLEVKMPGENMNLRELEWTSLWRGSSHIVRTAEEALYEIGALK